MKHLYHSFISFIVILIFLSSCKDDESLELNNQLNLNAYITYSDVKGIYEKGVPLDESNFIELHLYTLEGGRYNFTSKNTNGYQFKASGNIESVGDHIIELYGEGTPQVKQVDSVRIETDSSSRTIPIVISENLSNKVIITSATIDRSTPDYKTIALSGRGDILWEYPGLATKNYVNDGVVFINIGDVLKAVEITSGNILWEEPSVTSVTHILESDGKLYVSTASDYFIMESSTGNIISQGQYPASSKTQITEDKIIISTGSRVVVADKNTEEILWDKSGFIVSGRPSIAQNNLICTSTNGLFALNMDSGELAWETSLRTSGSIAYDGKNVIVTDSYNVYKIDPATGSTVWQSNLGNIIFSPEIYGDYVMVANETSLEIIHCLNINTGEALWDKSPIGFAQSELIAHENMVFLGTSSSLCGFSVETGNTEILLGDYYKQNDPMIMSYNYLLSVTNTDNMNTAYPTSIAPN